MIEGLDEQDLGTEVPNAPLALRFFLVRDLIRCEQALPISYTRFTTNRAQTLVDQDLEAINHHLFEGTSGISRLILEERVEDLRSLSSELIYEEMEFNLISHAQSLAQELNKPKRSSILNSIKKFLLLPKMVYYRAQWQHRN